MPEDMRAMSIKNAPGAPKNKSVAVRPLLDMSNVGAMDSTLAVDLSVAEDASNACN